MFINNISRDAVSEFCLFILFYIIIIMVIIFCLLVLIIILIFVAKYFIKTSKEQFQDPNTEFIVPDDNIITEKSVRFSVDKPYNSERYAFGFKDTNYFMKNKDKIFKLYKVDGKLIDYFNKNIIYNEDDIISDNNSEIGFGFDKNTDSSKIYISNKKHIKSLKLVNGSNIESVYTVDNNFDEPKFNKFIEKDNAAKIVNNFKTITFDNNEYSNQQLESNSKQLIQLLGEVEYNNSIKMHPHIKEIKSVSINNTNCFVRSDNGIFVGYHFYFNYYNLVIGKNSKFIKNLLKDIGCNIENIDTWINDNKDYVISWISFIKNNQNNKNFYTTIYYI
jgi:hypothetical protein